MLSKIEKILEKQYFDYTISKQGKSIEEINFEIDGDTLSVFRDMCGFGIQCGNYEIYVDDEEELPLLEKSLKNIKSTLGKLKKFDEDIENLKNTISKLEKLQQEEFADGWCGLQVRGNGLYRKSQLAIKRDAEYEKEKEEAYNQYMEKKYGKKYEEDEEK